LKARGIYDLPIISGLNFSPFVEQKRTMVSLSLASLLAFHFSPYSTKLQFGTPCVIALNNVGQVLFPVVDDIFIHSSAFSR
jgi:hypothetical protein